MKAHTSDFKDSIKTFGREIDDKITYTINNEEIELGNEELNSVSPHYEGAILKSVMKQLDIDSNVEIPVGTILNYQIGVKTGSEYEYVDYGNYVVYSIEKQEDTNSYKIICYDKMLYTMKEYENTDITYPTTVRQLLDAICEKVGLTYSGEQFANYDKEIPSELYLDSNGNSLGYTYRDVLDEIAQVSGGTICINNEDKVEVRYIHDVGKLVNVSNSNITATGESAELQKFELEGKTTQASTPSPSSPQELISVGYQNLLKNTSTDSGDNNYWFSYSTFDEATRTLTRSTTATTESYISHRLNGLKSGTTYTLTLYAKSNGYVSNMDLYCINQNTQGVKAISGLNLTTEYQKYIFTFTTASDVTYGANSMIRIDNNGSTQDGTEAILTIKDVCLVEGDVACNYIDYGKYGIEVKSVNASGNLFNKNDVLYGYLSNTGEVVFNTTFRVSDYIPTNDAHVTISGNYGASEVNCFYDENKNFITAFGMGTLHQYIARPIPTNAKYIRVTVRNTVLDEYQLELGTIVTDYKEYEANTCLYQLNNPLRGIGDVKDLLYIQNGKLYVERKIGNYLLNGTNMTFVKTSATPMYRYYFTATNKDDSARNLMQSSHFRIYPSSWSNDVTMIFGGDPNEIGRVYLQFSSDNTDKDTVQKLNTWLTNNNVDFDYVLATPYTEELGNVDIPSTYKGTTYIQTTDVNEPSMNVSYISEFEEIDEEMMKDVNVNFGEKYGPINTVVLSRSAGADKVALSYPADLPDEEKIAIEISDNQIMNDLNRADYLPDLLHQLKGLEYYINDFSSTGICYLDLCDGYRAKIGDVSYRCVMFNDNVNRTQGLEEQVYTDMPEEAKEEYQYIADDDRKTTQAYIIAKKSEGEIVAVTNKVDEVNGKVNTVEARQTATETTLNFKTQNIDENGNITEVTTTNGFTFNANGLDIHTSDNAFHTTIDEDSTEYKDGDTVVSTTSKDGSALRQLRMLEQNYYSYNASDITNIMNTENYDFVDERVEDNGEYVYATFYNGED